MGTPTTYGQIFTLSAIIYEVNNSNLFYCRHLQDPRNQNTICAISYQSLDHLLSLHQKGHEFNTLFEFIEYLKTI